MAPMSYWEDIYKHRGRRRDSWSLRPPQCAAGRPGCPIASLHHRI